MAKKILIVDDNSVNRKLLNGILKRYGYDLLEAKDGEEAVEIVSREMPDLILLDIMMPKKDGYEVCSELQSDSRFVNIPIIFISARAETADKIRGLECGGVDYVTKPFDGAEVLARVRVQLKIRDLTTKLISANKDLLEKQKRIDEDLEAAAGIQQSLLPSELPDIESINIAWRFMPCQSVGGDIFNVIRLDEDHYAIYMVDVSGHGVPSAMVSVSVSQAMQPRMGYLMKKGIDPPPFYEIVSPAKVLNALDQEYPIERFDKFFTISYLILNTRDGTLTYSNAAHPLSVLLHKDGTLELLKEGGTIIGMDGILPFEEGKKQMNMGDRLFVYTDGIVEYTNKEGAFYGEERFYAELQRLRDRPISGVIDGIVDSMVFFGDNIDPQDDVSLLGIEFIGKEKVSVDNR